MARYKKEGAPTNHTFCMIGDVYEDVTTGKRYSCVSSYSDSMGNKEYEWKEMTESMDTEPVIPEIPESKSEPEVQKTDIPKPNRDQQYDRNRNNYRNGHKTQYNKQYRPNSN